MVKICTYISDGSMEEVGIVLLTSTSLACPRDRKRAMTASHVTVVSYILRLGEV
jgi:hypothetical protein